MTKKELNQMYYLIKEIEMWKKALNDIEYRSLLPSQEITGMPFAVGISDKTGNMGTLKADITNTIKRLQKQADEEYLKIVKYIETIDDSLMKQIMYHRHALCMKWGQVARIVGGGNTSDGLRKLHDRFLEEK